MTLTQSFQEQYRTLTALPLEKRRFVLFDPKDHTGWGNKLRGFSLALLLSLATQRILVIREFLLEEHFLPPEGCLWSYSDWRLELETLGAETSPIVLHLAPTNWDEKEWQSYRTDSMDSLFPARVITINEGTGFSDQLIANPLYTTLWQHLGLDVFSKLSWVGTVCRAFLNRPTEKLVQQVELLRTKVGLTDGGRFGVVQFRTFFDIGSPRKPLVDAFFNETRRVLAEEGWEGVPLFIATDDTVVTGELAQALRTASPTIPSPTRVVHTGYTHTGWVRLAERVLQRFLGRDFWLPDFWGWLPMALRPRPHTAVLAEWYLYGQASFAISSFTSFAAYAMARTGNSARLYRFDAEAARISPLSDDSYDF